MRENARSFPKKTSYCHVSLLLDVYKIDLYVKEKISFKKYESNVNLDTLALHGMKDVLREVYFRGWKMKVFIGDFIFVRDFAVSGRLSRKERMSLSFIFLKLIIQFASLQT